MTLWICRQGFHLSWIFVQEHVQFELGPLPGGSDEIYHRKNNARVIKLFLDILQHERHLFVRWECCIESQHRISVFWENVIVQ